jgi:hypothetical protein
MQVFIFRKNARFYGEDLSTPRPTPKLEDHSLSAVRDCLFKIFAGTLRPQLENAPCRDDRDPLLVGKPEGKRPLRRPRLRWENYVKMDLQKVDVGVWTGLSWLRIGAGGGHF